MTEFYRTRAKGGVGLIVLDCPCLDYPRAYKCPHEVRFNQEEYASGLIELINTIHNEGSKVFMQLNYPKERAFSEPLVERSAEPRKKVCPALAGAVRLTLLPDLNICGRFRRLLKRKKSS